MLEELEHLLEAEAHVLLLTAGAGGALDGLLGEEALAVLEVEDALLDGGGDGELVDDDVDCLGETVDTVYGLFLNELGKGLLAQPGQTGLSGGKGVGRSDLRDSRKARQ